MGTNSFLNNKYNPMFYAAEGIQELEKALGMASRVYMGYNNERRSFGKGQAINITVPGSFTAQNAGTGSQDVNTQSVNITLSQHKEVQFEVLDTEITHGGMSMITDHIRPAMYALADNIDAYLMSLMNYIPWKIGAQAITSHLDITNPRKILRDNKVMLDDGDIHMAVSADMEAAFLGLNIFHQAQIVGASTNQDVLLRGNLGTRFGVEVFATQNAGVAHTSGTIVNGGDQSGALNGAHAKAATTVVTDAFTSGQTVKIGDSFVIAGNTQRYVATADATVDGSKNLTVSVWPPLVQAYPDNAVVTFENGATHHLDAYYGQLMFHRQAIALVVAPLPEIGNNIGAKVATVTDFLKIWWMI
ncbi:MAG: hypothetical protein HQK77_15335 [Desulfobacterales bacterium]|nr:hypothetical protein [Desulfobacterales bacterium]